MPSTILDCAELTPLELQPIVGEHVAPALHLTNKLSCVYWRSLGGYNSDGMILVYADPEEGFAACAEQYRRLREELALLGLSALSLVASVGSCDLEPEDRHDLELVLDLVKYQELEWVAIAGWDAISSNTAVSSTLIGELDDVELRMLPFEDVGVPGDAAGGELLEFDQQLDFARELQLAPDIPPADWSGITEKHGTYGIFVKPQALGKDETPEFLQLIAERKPPVYVGRTLNETVSDRLEEHAERIAKGADLDLGSFTARFIPAPDARVAYRGKRAVITVSGPPPWQRSGFSD